MPAIEPPPSAAGRPGPADRAWETAVRRIERALVAGRHRRGVAVYPDPWRYLERDLAPLFRRADDIAHDWLGFLAPGRAGVPCPVRRVLGAGRSRREELRFPSPRPSGIAPNDTVVAHRYRATGPARGTILFHHPVFRDTLRWPEWFVRPLRRHYDVVLMEAPFHLSRAPAGTWSGERLLNPNPLHLLEGMAQWMADHAALLAWLTAQAGDGDPAAMPRGLVGYSLGAYQSVLYARLDHRLPVVAVNCTNDYAYGVENGILSPHLRAAVRRAGISPDDWERLTAPLKLHPLAPALPRDRILIISGRYDEIEPFESIARFHDALRPRGRVLLPAGHMLVGALYRRRVMDLALAFLRETA